MSGPEQPRGDHTPSHLSPLKISLIEKYMGQWGG